VYAQEQKFQELWTRSSQYERSDKLFEWIW